MQTEYRVLKTQWGVAILSSKPIPLGEFTDLIEIYGEEYPVMSFRLSVRLGAWVFTTEELESQWWEYLKR